jgi:hypothetical protein
MPTWRQSLILLFLIFMQGCDRGVVKERADAIRERNARLDHVSKIRVTREIRKHWTIRGDAWFGKLPGGSFLRLESPVVTVAPVKAGRPVCCNWLGEVTITASRWDSHPASSSARPFVMKYQAILESAGHYTLTAIAGEDVTPLSTGEIAMFQAYEGREDSP